MPKDFDDKSAWPVVVLTLEGDDARIADLTKTLDNLAVDYQLFYGVDGRNGLATTEERLIDRASANRKYRRDLSDAELACALSHQRIYQAILANNWPGAIVLEDDAILDSSRFQSFVQQRAYKQADLIMLDHSHAHVSGKSFEIFEGVECFRLALPCCLTTGYSISTVAARFLIDAGTPLSDVADWPGDITELDAVVCSPRIVTHTDQASGPSHLRSQRAKSKPDPRRFLRSSYWSKWISKRRATRIS